MIWLCVALVGAAFAVNLPLTWWLIGAGRRWGMLDRPSGDAGAPGGHKAHREPTPVTGGIGIMVTLALLIVAAVVYAAMSPDATLGSADEIRDAPAWFPHLAGVRAQTGAALAILGAAVILHIMGLFDDRKPISANIKLYVQFFVAVVLVVAFEIRVLTFLDAHGPGGLIGSTVISVLWIVTIVNAINFLDNMDGLAGGVAAIIAAIYLAATLISGQWFVAALCAVLLGALLAFLIFNFPPAKVFMGDAGSTVVGLMLAVISVRTTYFAGGAPGAPAALGQLGGGAMNGAADAVSTAVDAINGGAVGAVGPPGEWHGVLMPLIVMAVPLYDITSVTLIRLAQGKSPFEADQQHFSHRLVARGLSRRAAVLVIWLCTLATGLGGVMLGRLEGWQAALVAVQTVAVLGVLALLERAGAKKRRTAETQNSRT